MNRILALFSLVAVSLTTCSPLHAQIDFDIVVNYTGPDEFQPLFDSAEAIWESILPERIDGRAAGSTFNSLTITASVGPIDGDGDGMTNTLAQAGPTSSVNDGQFILANTGIMQFDENDIDLLVGDGSFEDVILHEMGHVLGIGTLWEANGLYDGVNAPGEYIGEFGLAQYQQEFDSLAAFVPVELGGGPGTEDAHWDEGFPVDGTDQFTPTGLTVIDPDNANFGRLRSDALMTGFLDDDLFISNTTGGSLQDLGFVVDFDAIQAQAVPEPSSLAILAGFSLLSVVRRRR